MSDEYPKINTLWKRDERGQWWLRRDSVEDVAAKLGLDVVPIVMTASIPAAIDAVRNGKVVSAWPNARPEGLVGRPAVDLWDRKGQRIITKIKHRDFKHMTDQKGTAS